MKRKHFFVLIIILVCGMFILTGCDNNDRVKIENKLKSIQADVVITYTLYGGERNDNFEYYICYNDAKVYEYNIVSYYPITSSDDGSSSQNSNTYIFKEYNISNEMIEKIKKFIVNEQENKKSDGTVSDYKLSTGDQVYYVNDYQKLLEILNEIK